VSKAPFLNATKRFRECGWMEILSQFSKLSLKIPDFRQPKEINVAFMSRNNQTSILSYLHFLTFASFIGQSDDILIRR